jgi:hypothetical protein
MRRPLQLVILAVFAVMACCGVGLVFWDGYYLPNKPCRPISFPEGRRLGGDSSVLSKDTLITVEAFYDKHLAPKPTGVGDIGDWRKDKLTAGGYRYWCFGNDINLLTTETGCIDIREVDAGTVIDYRLRRSEGASAPCPSQ